jgi:hypothetical protein
LGRHGLNLQQQSVPFFLFIFLFTNSIVSYRIHLSPGSRRNSICTNTPRKRTSVSRSPEPVTPQHPGTPSLHHGRLYDSTSPLAQVTLPSAANVLLNSPSSSPGTSYSPDPHHTLPALSSPGLSLSVPPPLNYNYLTVSASYHDNPYPTFVNNAAGASQNSLRNAVGSSTNFTYSHPHPNYGGHSQQNSRSTSPSTTMHSRHSLSHISNSRYPSSHVPPSPTSGSSKTSHSGSSTPSYPVSCADNHTHSYYPHHSATVTSQPAVHSQLQSQSYLFQNAYTPNAVIANSPRYLQ